MKQNLLSTFLVLCFLIIGSTNGSSQRTVGLFQNSPESAEGYTLFTSDLITYLIDDCGRQVHSWTSTLRPGLTAYITENGDLVRAGIGNLNISGPGGGGTIEQFDWEGNLLWSYNVKDSTGIQHHDIEPLPNGNILVIAWEIKLAEEAIQAGANTNLGYWPLVIFEIEPKGADDATIVWEWHAWDHLIQDFDDTKDNFGIIAEHPELIDINHNPPLNGGDWLHANSIDYNETRDEILISARHTGEIYIIDHSTTTTEAAAHSGGNKGKGGDLLYRWGNPQVYDRGTASDQTLFRQHDAQWVPDEYVDAGKISIFNNGAGRLSGDFSSVDLISPEIAIDGNYTLGSDAAYGPIEAEWTYKDEDPLSFFLPNMGGAHRLKNGNTLITNSRNGIFLEVDVDGNSVWQYTSPISISGPLQQGSGTSQVLATFRATRYESSFQGFDGRDLSPGERIELNPLPLDCNLDVTTSISSLSELTDVALLSNLIQDQVIIENSKSRLLHIEVFNAVGQKLWFDQSQNNLIEIDLSNTISGIYFIRMTDLQASKTTTVRAVKMNN